MGNGGLTCKIELRDIYILFTILRNNVIYYNQKAEGVEKADAMEAFMDDPTVDL